MPILDVGDPNTAAADMVQLAVSTGQTVTVANLSGSAANLNVFQNGIDQAPTSVTPGNNVAVSTVGPFWIQNAVGGIASAQVTGGLYGGV